MGGVRRLQAMRWPGIGRASAVAAVLAVSSLAIWVALMATGWIRAPYSSFAKQLAWLGGFEERAYNFGVVVPGRVYRSGRPDMRFLHTLRERYGVERIVSLNDENDFHDAARAAGFDVTVFDWSTNRLPPAEELERVLGAMDEGPPVLVHCSQGADRSGYAVAEYRITRQGWPLPRVFEEMNGYWHKPDERPWFQAALRGKYGSGEATAGDVAASGSGPAPAASGSPGG